MPSGTAAGVGDELTIVGSKEDECDGTRATDSLELRARSIHAAAMHTIATARINAVTRGNEVKKVLCRLVLKEPSKQTVF